MFLQLAVIASVSRAQSLQMFRMKCLLNPIETAKAEWNADKKKLGSQACH